MHYLVFLGSTRTEGAPRPTRLGWRVAQACLRLLEEGGVRTTLVDPLTVPREENFRPHFSYPKGRVPEALDALAGQIRSADGYVMISPEYNHSMSPALADLLNHFGSSLFSYRPSAIVSYSAGQWGGTRAAVAMRAFLSELGCLPVSAMIHVPRAGEALTEDGDFAAGEDGEAWSGYFGRTFSQLAWWAEACQAQWDRRDPASDAPAFQRNPSQRNAP
ncbi:NADPH-dependent FMN reductase [Natronospira bacteriovora]|uniref:NAD(P)H-dependent oxidoreductase n=1 Tax=Natronospira bacteriovora TaxID=3069753 RepID=A0ABU0W3N3_9GAMM|nr:NAD(P)H-dependent oxidoreductase [Natronospira sp. AB-CW4]MDQ2068630.1 NAD(P)H-dependent oxidoreductase [Natronospira sp. AB-CW4]